MHLKKEVNQNPPGTNDPRLRRYFVYQCSVCNHEHDYNWVPNFQHRLRACPNCGVTDDSSDNEYLLQRQQSLEQKIASLEAQTQDLREELLTIQAKLKVSQTINQVKESV